MATPVAHQGDKIWFEDVGVLSRRWKEFFPCAQQTPAERVNAIVRLIAYATAAAFVYNREARTLVLGAGAIAVVTFAFNHRRNEAFPLQPLVPPGDRACTRPTKDNPFANVLLTDLGKERPPACPYDEVKGEVKQHFNDGLFRNATDIYDNENSQHQFHTMPVTTIIPDTGAFANFLYGGMKSCKEDGIHCPTRM